jgi:hypothetical protein
MAQKTTVKHGVIHASQSHAHFSGMAHESAAVGKVRLYLEAAGLIDRDTFSKVFTLFVPEPFCLGSQINANS